MAWKNRTCFSNIRKLDIAMELDHTELRSNASVQWELLAVSSNPRIGDILENFDSAHYFPSGISLLYSLKSSSNIRIDIAQATAAANRILSFRVRDRELSKETSILQDADGGVKIEFQDVFFKYPTRDIPIFSGLSLTIEKGQFAALVGPSGCGKTRWASTNDTRGYTIDSPSVVSYLY